MRKSAVVPKGSEATQFAEMWWCLIGGAQERVRISITSPIAV